MSKKKKKSRLASASPGNSGSSDESDWGSSANEKKKSKTTTSISDDENEEIINDVPQIDKESQISTTKKVKQTESEPEEGEVSDSDEESGDASSDSSSSEFNDGYDENLMGDEEDRKRLEGLSEKERETELYKRIERREIMRTRWEIERKLRLARRAENIDRKPKTKKKKKKKQNAEPVRTDTKVLTPSIVSELPPPAAPVAPIDTPEKKADTCKFKN